MMPKHIYPLQPSTSSASAPPTRMVLALALAALCLLAPGTRGRALAEELPGHNFLGGDYYHFPIDEPLWDGATPFEYCSQYCTLDPRCRAVTLVAAGVQSEFPMCWLKDGNYVVQENPATDSWLKPVYASYRQRDYPGGDFRSIEFLDPAQDPHAGAMQCRRECERDSRCLAFTFVAPGFQSRGGVCWLKDRVGGETYAPGCYSGLVYERQTFSDPDWLPATDPQDAAGSTPPESSLRDVNLPGLDYANFALTTYDPALCLAACEDDPNCRAYTYVAPGQQGRHARCWLKYGVPAQVRNAHTVSGVVR